MTQKIICIAGPTASGKTSLAVALAKELNGEVVSCDSMQIYRYMDIGTAKPTRDEMQGIPHHMLDVADPNEDFSVSRYCEMASPIIDDILARGKTAIVGNLRQGLVGTDQGLFCFLNTHRKKIFQGCDMHYRSENFMEIMRQSSNPNQRAICPEKVRRKKK